MEEKNNVIAFLFKKIIRYGKVQISISMLSNVVIYLLR